MSFMLLMNIPINEENDDLLTLYWIAKLNESIYKKVYCRFFYLSVKMPQCFLHSVTKSNHVVVSIKCGY